jgi:uncharacterized protein (TIGR00251 family)
VHLDFEVTFDRFYDVMIISVKIKPNARQSSIRMENGTITIRVQAPPHDGEANDALIKFLAAQLGIPKSSVSIVGGHASPFKRLEIPDHCKELLHKVSQS